MPDRLKITYLNAVPLTDSNRYLIANLGLHILSMDMHLAKVKLLRKHDGTVYVSPPSEEYVDPKTGKKAWASYFWFGEKSSSFFQKEALEAIKLHCMTKGMPDLTIARPVANLTPSCAFGETSVSTKTQNKEELPF